MPDRPGLDDSDALKNLIGLWRDGERDMELRQARVWEQVQAEIARIGTGNTSVRLDRLRLQADRLWDLRLQAVAVVEDLTERTRDVIEAGLLIDIYGAGAGATGLPFSFTLPHRAAVEVLAADTFDDVLAVTKYLDEEGKAFVRGVGRQLTGFKLTSGTPVKAQARRLRRDLAREFESRGITAITYRDGSRHGFGEYAEMLLRTKTGVAYNAGTINRSFEAGIRWFEILDGAECGLVAHNDPEKANGRIVPLDFAQAYPLSHPNCRRAIAPRPDINTPAEAGWARSVQSEAARTDQAQFEAFLAAGGRGSPGPFTGPVSSSARRPNLPSPREGSPLTGPAATAAQTRAAARRFAAQAAADAAQAADDLAAAARGQESAAYALEQAARAAANKAAAEIKAKKSAAAKKGWETRKAREAARADAAKRNGVVMPERQSPLAGQTTGNGLANSDRHEVTLTEWLEALTTAERSAVARYTGSDYLRLNQALYQLGGDIDKLDGRGGLDQFARDLNSAIRKHPVRSEPATTYRGLRSHPEFIRDVGEYFGAMAEGDIYRTTGFGSTTLQPTVAQSFAGGVNDQMVMMKIRTYSQPNIIDISGYGMSEAEVLFTSGQALRVTKAFDPVTRIIELEEVMGS